MKSALLVAADMAIKLYCRSLAGPFSAVFHTHWYYSNREQTFGPVKISYTCRILNAYRILNVAKNRQRIRAMLQMSTNYVRLR